MKHSLKVAVAVTAAAALAFSVSGCAQQSKKLSIAFVMGAEADPFFQAMKVGAQAEADAQGVDLIWTGDPANYSAATQVPYVNNVIAQHPDGLVLIPTDPDGLQQSVSDAVAAGIQVANVDTNVNDLSDVVTFITGDNVDGGAKAADALAAAMGYTDGNTYEVAIGLTSATETTNVSRAKGFEDAIAAKYPGIKVVAKDYSGSNSATADANISAWLTKFPNLAGVFAIDGTDTTGAVSAVSKNGLEGKVQIVGYDAYPDNVALVKSGKIAALISQVPAEEAKQAIDTLVAKIKDGTDPATKNVVIPNFVITKDTSDADLAKYTYVK